MIKINKITLKKLEGVIVPKPELKFIVGGCDPIDDVEIGGEGWACTIVFIDGYPVECMVFSGKQSDYCDLSDAC